MAAARNLVHVTLLNRQRSRKLDTRRLRKITLALLGELQLAKAELGVTFVADEEMTLVNETFLQHEGSTDVITFDHTPTQDSQSNPSDCERSLARSVPPTTGMSNNPNAPLLVHPLRTGTVRTPGNSSQDTMKLGDGTTEAAHNLIHGELFICVDEAVRQARRFRTTWQSELIRYMVHGVLHLIGHDDHRAADRLKMKREENRLVRKLARLRS